MPLNVIDEVKVEDFYTKLLKLIDSVQEDEAFELFKTLKTKSERLGVLGQLTHALANNLANAHAPARPRALASALATDLVRASDLARALASALATDLANVRALVHDLDLDLDLAQTRARFVFLALGGEVSSIEKSIEEVQSAPSMILEGVETLTASNLSRVVSPYLEAVVDLQRTLSPLMGLDFIEPHISLISQNSPLEAVITGVAGAIGIIREMVVPWRRKHAQEMAELAKQREKVEIAKTEAEAQRTRVESVQKRQDIKKIDDEALSDLKLKNLQIERMQLENDEKRLDIARKKSEFALSIIEKIAPNASEKARAEYLAKLLPALNVLVESPLELK